MPISAAQAAQIVLISSTLRMTFGSLTEMDNSLFLSSSILHPEGAQ